MFQWLEILLSDPDVPFADPVAVCIGFLRAADVVDGAGGSARQPSNRQITTVFMAVRLDSLFRRFHSWKSHKNVPTTPAAPEFRLQPIF